MIFVFDFRLREAIRGSNYAKTILHKLHFCTLQENGAIIRIYCDS